MEVFDNSILQFACCVQTLEKKVVATFNYPWVSGVLTVRLGGGLKGTVVCSRMQCSSSLD
jgi:hypothetical protein